MARRRRMPLPQLDPGGISSLPEREIHAILRAAEAVVWEAGRNLLGKILKGSKSKELLKLGLEEAACYGFYADLTLAEIGHRVDWMIEAGYFELSNAEGLPFLNYTEKGLAIEVELIAREWFEQLREMSQGEGPYLVEFLKDRPRRTVLRLLDMIEDEADASLIPVLTAWQKIDYQKVQKRIRQVKAAIRGDGGHREGKLIEWE